MGMSNDDLTSAIQDVNGIGEKKAAEILTIFEDHEVGRESDLLVKARECASEGKDRRAGMFLRRDMGEE